MSRRRKVSPSSGRESPAAARREASTASGGNPPVSVGETPTAVSGDTTGEETPPRVGIVLVSHSREVADSVARLAVGLAAGRSSAPVAGAGGGPDGGLGTSAELIGAAAHKVDTGAGVAILVDLGSAVLTVKVLLAEGDELPENSQLVDAPLVEGAIAAVVASAGGADLAEVAAAAEEAYHFRKV